MQIYDLRCEHRPDPIGIGNVVPRLSWKVSCDRRGAAQIAYQLRVAGSLEDLERDGRLLFDSGRVASVDCVLVELSDLRMEAHRRYYWRVRVWDEQDIASDWSDPAFWEVGLLQRDWSARWISPAGQGAATGPSACPILRHDFTFDRSVERARLYVSARGLYEVRLNGRRVGQDLFTPGWTSYRRRIQYQTYDVTDLLSRGANAVGAILGDGWFRGPLGMQIERNSYGTRLALILQLEVEYDDGSRETITSSSGDWRCSTGPILSSEMQDGERYDARLESPGWDTAGFDDGEWSGVEELPHGADLIPQSAPPVRRMMDLVPAKIAYKAGCYIVDFGQNMVGWVRLAARGGEGTTIKLRHAEMLGRDGQFHTTNLRNAKQECVYTLRGSAEDEIFEPHFTFQGFRYVEVSGYPGELTADRLIGVVIHSDMPSTGSLETSNPLLNQLQSNITWSQKGNFVDVPTDCPQRDERLGWTGDAQVFAPTASFNMDVAAFFTKWLGDLAAEQGANGAVPFICPDIMGGVPCAGWSDAALLIPWMLYERYGDRGILKTHYRTMQRWVAYMDERAGPDRIWSGDHQFGDWLDFFSTSRGVSFGLTSGDLVATAYFARSTALLAKIARILGDDAAAETYDVMFEAIRTAFCRRYVTSDGVIGEDTQTAYAMALEFGLLTPEMRIRAAERLVRDVRARGHLTTGFLGTPILLDALTNAGFEREAFQLLTRTEFPSWLYPVTKGATTIWERWNAILPDGAFFPREEMNSFNHYAYGAVGDWIYRNVGGIAPDANRPGYRHVIVAPRPGGGLTFAAATHHCPYGEIATRWAIDDGRFELNIRVPVGATASVRLPFATLALVEESGQRLDDAAFVDATQDGDCVCVEIGSGVYSFGYPLDPAGSDAFGIA